MFTRAFRICDPVYLEEELQHIKSSFSKLAYPPFFINDCLSRARSRFYNPKVSQPFSMTNNITLPYSHNLEVTQKEINRLNNNLTDNDKISMTFSYSNTIRNKLVRNSSRSRLDGVGVYCIPCKDCNQCYIGETGRGLDVRISEHKRACRLGHQYNAVASHSWTTSHRVGFDQARIVHKNSNLSTRKLVEGALISLNNTFPNNKSSTNEDVILNLKICQLMHLHDCIDIATTLSPAAFPLSPQVMAVPHNDGTIITGAYADAAERPPADPPDEDEANNPPIPRRSLRIQRRNQHN